MGFGVLYIAEWLRRQPLEQRVAFARLWLSQILGSLLDRPGPIFLARVVRRLRDAGVADAERLAPQMLREQQAINEAELAEAAVGGEGAASPEERAPRRTPGARDPGRARLRSHPLIRGALRGSLATSAD